VGRSRVFGSGGAGFMEISAVGFVPRAVRSVIRHSSIAAVTIGFDYEALAGKVSILLYSFGDKACCNQFPHEDTW
jgi:hypothetical protein